MGVFCDAHISCLNCIAKTWNSLGQLYVFVVRISEFWYFPQGIQKMKNKGATDPQNNCYYILHTLFQIIT
jgi:hypothetical protein